jgi:Tol biopolymer transport system component/Ser/Thr protein kinase RdoA (MazF antagonist)
MGLSAGTRLGPYEITGSLGAGGMGEVYRARDTRLDRSVAVKILPEHLAADPSLRARFDREARAVSALNHPHICTLHDIGEQDGVHFLVMEHLEGETLERRLERGALPPGEAVAVAAQIAQALAAAHRHGVVHRDLKPANVMLTKAGAKLLDFGLAKQGPDAGPPMSSAVMTKGSPLTIEGTIVGTWQYMSPEQLEGQEADARSDLFAFGALLYEMLAGRRAFQAKSQAGLIAAIMGSDPPALSAAAPACPPALERLVRRCLAKDPDDRWQSAADLASELQWIGAGEAPSRGGGAAPSTGSGALAGEVIAARRAAARERLAWAALTLALLAAAGVLAARAWRGAAESPRLAWAALPAPAGARIDPRCAPAVSADGASVAFVVAGAQGESRLWVRKLDAPEARPLADTEGAAHPFWSPDGRWLGFFSGGQLKKIDVAGGPAIGLCEARDGRGGSWSPEGVILFQPRFSDPLYRVPAGGGTPEPVTALDESRFEIAHRWPHFLPDGKRFLFYVVSTTNPSTSEHSGIYAGSLGSTETRMLLRVDSRMAYAQGHLLYKRGSTLMAQRFDPERLELQGDPIPLAADVLGGVFSWGGAEFGVSGEGVLAFLAGKSQGETELAWFDRSGQRLGQLGEPEIYWDPRLSHDGRRVVLGIGRDSLDLWLHDLGRDVRTRFTFDPANDLTPVWSPDDARIAFSSARVGMGELYRRDAAGTGQDELLFSSDSALDIGDWSPDGRLLVFSIINRQTGLDLWTYSFEDGKARPWLEGPEDQWGPRLSPDGRWIAYASDESGRYEIYVRSFPDPQKGRWQVSRAGGFGPTWRADGRELFYLVDDGTLMAVDVRTQGSFDSSTPRSLFQVSFKRTLSGMPYDAAPDGQRFLINTAAADDTTGQAATLLLNWTEALPR